MLNIFYKLSNTIILSSLNSSCAFFNIGGSPKIRIRLVFKRYEVLDSLLFMHWLLYNYKGLFFISIIQKGSHSYDKDKS